MFYGGAAVADKLQEIQERIEKDPTNDALWLEKGMELIAQDKPAEARMALNKGLYYNPFNGHCHHRRGRKYISEGRYAEGLADIIMAARLDYDNHEHWYYQGVAASLAGYYQIAIDAFERAIVLMKRQGVEEWVACVEWMWVTYMKWGKKEEAAQIVKTVDENTPCIPRSLSYKRKVLLYNGTIPPEDFLDREAIKKRDRPELYLIGELYGLGNYYISMGQPEKGVPLLQEARQVPTWHSCFAYQQACNDLKAMGL